MCNCKDEIEAELTKRLAANTPELSEHKVELSGYGISFNRETGTASLRPFMTAKGIADKTKKNGNIVYKKFNHPVAFSYCPFCGEKFGNNAA